MATRQQIAFGFTIALTVVAISTMAFGNWYPDNPNYLPWIFSEIKKPSRNDRDIFGGIRGIQENAQIRHSEGVIHDVDEGKGSEPSPGDTKGGNISNPPQQITILNAETKQVVAHKSTEDEEKERIEEEIRRKKMAEMEAQKRKLQMEEEELKMLERMHEQGKRKIEEWFATHNERKGPYMHPDRNTENSNARAPTSASKETKQTSTQQEHEEILQNQEKSVIPEIRGDAQHVQNLDTYYNDDQMGKNVDDDSHPVKQANSDTRTNGELIVTDDEQPEQNDNAHEEVVGKTADGDSQPKENISGDTHIEEGMITEDKQLYQNVATNDKEVSKQSDGGNQAEQNAGGDVQVGQEKIVRDVNQSDQKFQADQTTIDNDQSQISEAKSINQSPRNILNSSNPAQPEQMQQEDNIVQSNSITNNGCTPQKNIVLLKTHKTGGSTLQNILYRYGDTRSLVFALPSHENYFGSPALFHPASTVMKMPGGYYNILANHARFERNAFHKLMPKDTKYITIIRYPPAQFESMYNYYQLRRRFKASFFQFARSPESLYNKYEVGNKGTRHTALNPMLFDLGLKTKNLGDDAAIQRQIRHIDREFDLVFIAEYFEESAILLKELMCWDFDDVTFFSMNKRSTSKVKTVTSPIEESLLKWNKGDWMLYQHFNRTFWQKIDAFGRERMEQEKAILSKKIEELTSLCIKRTIDKKSLNGKALVEAYELRPTQKENPTCVSMTIKANVYLSRLKQKMKRRRGTG